MKLVYPDFADNVQLKISKDFFIKGVHSEMQVALKSLSHFKDCDINTLAKETVRLELAGVKSQMHLPPPNVNNVDEEKSLVDAIANKVMDKIENLSLEANQISRGQNRYQRGRNNANRGRRGNNRQPPRCRSCQVSGHVVHDCPTRFCQACGGKGHDAWQRSCPNYIWLYEHEQNTQSTRSAVVIPTKMNNAETNAMLDTGAAVRVTKTLDYIKASWKQKVT